MPLFHIHVHTGTKTAKDPEGIELPDLEAARSFAGEEARSLVAAKITKGSNVVDLKLLIESESGELLAVIPVSARVLGLS